MTDETEQKVAAYLEKHRQWSAVLAPARKVLLDAGMTETVKWGTPTYTIDGKNVISLAGFKNHCAVWFHNGVFLKDPEQRLINAQSEKTKGLRQWRFEDGDKLTITLFRSYVKEAIRNQQAGLEIKPEKPVGAKPTDLPIELREALDKNKKLKQAFLALSPGKQREYASHVASAKQEKTRLSRVEKAVPQIISGLGLYDKYKKG